MRAADGIVEQLERQIRNGELADAEPLPAERELMQRFGASRTVVREAITALANRGLIEAKPRFRPVVKKPDLDTALASMSGMVDHLLSDPKGVRDLFDVRIFVEKGLVREAALQARRPDIERLERALAENKQAVDDSDLFYRTDVAFHAVFYGISNNPMFPAMHRAFVSWLAGHWDRMPRSPERNRVNFKSHEGILEAVRLRDPDAAEAALVNHLNAAWEYVRVTFDEDEP